MEKITKKPRAARKPAPLAAGQAIPGPSGVTDALRAAMKDSGLSAYRLARDSGVDVAAILRFMSEQRSLKLSSVDRLAELLGLELAPVKQRKG